MIIAIDGPAGSGKTTIARKLSRRLKIKYIDSGAIYRTMTLYGMETFDGSCLNHENEIAEYFRSCPRSLKIVYENQTQKMLLDGRDVSDLIRTLEVTGQVKHIADNVECREIVNSKMREIARECSVVAEGRDIGDKVFPDTPYKFYLDAGVEVRAARRAEELGMSLDGNEFKRLLKAIGERDQNDMNREIAPLRRAADAFFIDTSELDVYQVAEKIFMKIQLLKSP